MPVFISYSQKDDDIYKSFCQDLNSQKINHWSSESMQVGKSLREQLKLAINNTDVCVFLATRKSIKSQWCNAELGAFWGKGITVIVLIVDPGLRIKKLPPQFKGDLSTRDQGKVFASIKAELESVSQQKRIDYGIKIVKPITESVVKNTVEVSGTFTIKPAYHSVAIWECDRDNGFYWPKKYIDFGQLDNSWSTKIEIGGKQNSKRSIMITSMGDNGKALFEYARKVIDVNRKAGGKYNWPGVQILTEDIIVCDSVDLILSG